jgi:single-strand DNA-binding protein
MNSICLIGNICNDIELRATQTGKSVCSFDLAVRRPFTKDITDFFNVVCWGKNAESVSQYCGKGSRIAVTGMLTSRKYQDKEGKNRTAIEVVADEVTFLNSKTDEGSAQSSPSTTSTPYNATSEEFAEFVEMSEDSDLPF